VSDLLKAVLDYNWRPWRLVPTKNGKAIHNWRRFIDVWLTEEEHRQHFARPGIDGVSVILAEPSDSLACRHFNTVDAYERWTAARPDLSKSLPAAKTGHEVDLFFRAVGRDKKLKDGEYIFNSSRFRLLPPSLCNGSMCEWIAPLPEGHLPAIDPEAAGLFAVPQPGASNGASEMQDALRLAEEYAAEIVKQAGVVEEWRVPFRLARKMRRIAHDRPQRFRDVVKRFCELTGYNFDDVWLPFLKVFPETLVAEGQDAFDAAARLAVDEAGRPSPKLLSKEWAGDKKVNLVASLAYHLDALRDGKPIYLPRVRIAKWLGTRPTTVTATVGLLLQEGILKPHDETYSYAGKRKCKEYTFAGKRG
jgi:hypothetical protein